MKEEIVVVNRVHLDEYDIGDQVDQLFAEGPIPGVRLITRDAPEDAKEQRGRVPGSNPVLRQANRDGDLDEQFLWEIEQAAKHARAVVDIHGHKLKGTASYPFYGELARHNPLALRIASLLGSDSVLVHPTTLYLPAKIPCYGGWDLAPGTDVKALRPILERLGAGWCPPIRPMVEYCYLRGIFAADVPADHGLKEKYEQFEPLPTEAVAKLGLPPGSCAFDWDASLYLHTGTGFWGEVVIPLPRGVQQAPPSTA